MLFVFENCSCSPFSAHIFFVSTITCRKEKERFMFLMNKHGHIVADCPEHCNNTIIWQKYAKANLNIAHWYKNKFPKNYKSKGNCFKGNDCTQKNCLYNHPFDSNAKLYFVNSNTSSTELPVWGGSNTMFYCSSIPSFDQNVWVSNAIRQDLLSEVNIYKDNFLQVQRLRHYYSS